MPTVRQKRCTAPEQSNDVGQSRQKGGEQILRIVYSKSAIKFLSKLDQKSVTRIRDAIAGLTHNPPEGDIRLMQGFSDGRKRLRVGAWRVIYRLDRDGMVEILFIIDIGNRGDIYK